MADCNNCSSYLSSEDIIRRSVKCSGGSLAFIGSLLNQNEPEVDAYIDGLATPLSSWTVTKLNTLVKNIKTRAEIDSLTELLDLWILPIETEESSLKNLVKNAHHCTKHGSVSFIPFEGFTGDGLDGYLNTHYNPTSDGDNFKLNDASLGVYIRTKKTESKTDFGARMSLTSYTSYINTDVTGQLQVKINNTGTSITHSLYDSYGTSIANRTGVNIANVYKNGIKIIDSTEPSTQMANGDLYVCACNQNGTAINLSTKQISSVFAGKGLTDAQAQIISEELDIFMKSNQKSVVMTSNEPTLILTFDDGLAEHATVAKDMFITKGVRPTLYIVTDWIGTAGHLTVADLQTLLSDGWDIQCHSKDHSHLQTLTEAQLITNFTSVNSFFTSNSLPIPKHHAYPFGEYNSSNLIEVVSRYRLTAREIGNVGTIYNTIPFRLRISAAKVLDNLTVINSTITSIIDSIASSGGVGIFYGHGVYVTNSSESGYLNPTKLSAIEEIIDYAVSKGVKIKTMSEAYNDFV